MTKLEKEYRDWLVDRVNIIENMNYGPLLRELYEIEFYSLVKYDEDRGMDGLVLRDNWFDEIGHNGSVDWGEPRVLEVLIGIALRVEFQLYGSPYSHEWDHIEIFWDMIWNLGLEEFSGTLSGVEYDKNYEIVTYFLQRKYKRHKKGNIFILENSEKDLSKLNIWSQMMLYIDEKWPN